MARIELHYASLLSLPLVYPRFHVLTSAELTNDGEHSDPGENTIGKLLNRAFICRINELLTILQRREILILLYRTFFRVETLPCRQVPPLRDLPAADLEAPFHPHGRRKSATSVSTSTRRTFAQVAVQHFVASRL